MRMSIWLWCVCVCVCVVCVCVRVSEYMYVCMCVRVESASKHHRPPLSRDDGPTGQQAGRQAGRQVGRGGSPGYELNLKPSYMHSHTWAEIHVRMTNAYFNRAE